MKIQLVSDLHLEFGEIPKIKRFGADVLILSGDICVAEDFYRASKSATTPSVGAAMAYQDFFDQVSHEFPHVIYVAGNHEFYKGKWPGHFSVIRDAVKGFQNIRFLEKESVEIDGVLFIGSILWTNMNNYDAVTMYTVQNGMNDFNLITFDKGQFTKLRPVHVASYHSTAVQYIEQTLTENKNKTCVVVTHHAPTYESIERRYRNERHMNGAYASDLSELILDNPQIKLWTHGHTHHSMDYMVGDTRVVCNPKGYPGEPSGWKHDLIIEV